MQEFFKSLLWFVLGGALGGLIGWFIGKRYVEKNLEKNPPINEKMIRAMYKQMGITPSEAQIRQTMKQMNLNK